MFESDAQQLEDFRLHFYNLSLAMDCGNTEKRGGGLFLTALSVSCFRCKLWGKLQVQGLATALRLLYGGSGSAFLTRNALVAFVNALHQVSSSLRYVQQIQMLMHNIEADGSSHCVVVDKEEGGKPISPLAMFARE